MSTSTWNEEGRARKATIGKILDGVIDEKKPGKAFPGDERDAEVADAVLAEVVALNAAGSWEEARAKYDPAHAPFIHHMEETALQGLTMAVILGPDSFLVRRGDDTEEVVVVHIDGDELRTLEGAVGFAISRDRHHLAIAGASGVVVTRGFNGPTVATLAWPTDAPIVPWRMSVSDDGSTVVLGNDAEGLWLGRLEGKEPRWVKLVPQPKSASDDKAEGDDKGEEDDDEDAVDVIHGVLSPDGRWVAYAWQDAPGTFVEAIGPGLALTRHCVMEAKSDYPYNELFSDDSKAILANARHLQSGATVYATLDSLEGTEPYGEKEPEGVATTDGYLRAYGLALWPAAIEAGTEEVACIGGAGWAHAARTSGGKPVFTHFFGSQLHAFDYDPTSRRAIVASSSGMLHVLDPFTRAEPGREEGYRPRKELYRWIFWDGLDAPIRW